MGRELHAKLSVFEPTGGPFVRELPCSRKPKRTLSPGESLAYADSIGLSLELATKGGMCQVLDSYIYTFLHINSSLKEWRENW